MPVSHLFVLLVALTVFSAAVFYLSRPISVRRALVLLLLRTAAAGLVLLIFFEPSFKITRFSTSRPEYAVLADASQSMRLFKAGSIMESLVSTLEQYRGENNNPLKISYWNFGDSLRRNPSRVIEFEDRKSVFPFLHEEPELTRAGTVIITTDGNWSNLPGHPRDTNTNYYYVLLPQITGRPYIRLETRAVPDRSVAGSPAAIEVRISGHSYGKGPVNITCSSNGQTISARVLEPGEGKYSDSLLLRIPSGRTGSFLYETRAESETDSIYAVSHAVHHVIPERFSAWIYCPRPLLDKRFLKLCVHDREDWIMADPDKTPPQNSAVFFFAWDDTARKIFQRLPARAAAIFMGCLPCRNPAFLQPSSFTPLPGIGLISDSYKTVFYNLPSPTAIAVCPGSGVQGKTVLSAAISHGEKTDTIPALFETYHNRKRIIVSAAGGFWRMQFWPLSLRGADTEKSFGNLVLDMAENLILSNVNNAFFAFVENSPSYDTDSLRFRIILPAEFMEILQDTVRMTITSETADTARDTTVYGISQAGEYASITVPPLPPGAYTYALEARNGTRNERYDNLLHVHESNKELLVTGQNTIALDRFATPVEIDDIPAVLAQSGEFSGREQSVTTMPIRISRNWPAFILILTLLGAEWFLRRNWRLD